MNENIFSKTIKYYHTIKYLKPIQIYGQLVYRFTKPKINKGLPPELRKIPSNWTKPISKISKIVSPNKVCLLNQEKDITAKSIWSDVNIDKLWLYNLHYFDVIHASDEINTNLHEALIKRWIIENPPVHGYGWDPYTLSLRIVNWIKWFLGGNASDLNMLHSLAVQIRFLFKRIEIHLLGNHIFANAKALLFAGLFFDGNEADLWFKKGMKLFNIEITEQVLSDGGHFELSPMYHSIIMEDILDIINLFKTYGLDISPKWLQNIDKMFFWLQNLCHPDGKIAFFNDTALDIAPTFQELAEYRKRLALNDTMTTSLSSIYFAESGYCRMQHNDALLLADIGEVGATYQPGHAHADTLSFELSLKNQRLIVNSGISTYSDNIERIKQRGSQSHNTLVVDDYNSSEIWKSFRVARRAQVFDVKMSDSKEKMSLKASHNGYYRINKIVHTRIWCLTGKKLIIQDQVRGYGFHKLQLIFHIHPDINLIQEDERNVIFNNQSNDAIAFIRIDSPIKILDSTYHPSFNVIIPNKKIVVDLDQYLPANLNTIIRWN